MTTILHHYYFMSKMSKRGLKSNMCVKVAYVSHMCRICGSQSNRRRTKSCHGATVSVRGGRLKKFVVGGSRFFNRHIPIRRSSHPSSLILTFTPKLLWRGLSMVYIDVTF